mgnify:CR=1 FL=1
MIKLYDLVGRDDRRFSPTCWRVKMALAHKGLDWTTIPTAFTLIPALAGGTARTVPLIDHDGHLVADSRRIARYLEDSFPDRPPLFGSAAAEALTDFVDAWVLETLHKQLIGLVVFDIHEHCLDCDRAYFRASREQRFERRLEDVQAGRDERVAAFRAGLLPLRLLLERHPYLGGRRPIYADYIVLGAFQWVRSVSDFRVLADDDPLRDYLSRLMALHDGLARKAVAYPL